MRKSVRALTEANLDLQDALTKSQEETIFVNHELEEQREINAEAMRHRDQVLNTCHCFPVEPHSTSGRCRSWQMCGRT